VKTLKKGFKNKEIDEEYQMIIEKDIKSLADKEEEMVHKQT
jgi:hypothetical protein